MPPRSPSPDRFSSHQPTPRSADASSRSGIPIRTNPIRTNPIGTKPSNKQTPSQPASPPPSISLPPIWGNPGKSEAFVARPNPFAPPPRPVASVRPTPPPTAPRSSRRSQANSRTPLRKRQNWVNSNPTLPSLLSGGRSSGRSQTIKPLYWFIGLFSKLDLFSPSAIKTFNRSSRENRRRQRDLDHRSFDGSPTGSPLPSEGENTASLGLEPDLRSDSSSLPQSKGRSPSRSRSTRLPAPLLYGIRLLILGIGLGVIAGTLLAALDPNYQQMVKATETSPNSPCGATKSKTRAIALKNALPLGQELTELTQKLQGIANQEPDLVVGVFVVDLDTGAYAAVNGQRSFATASMINVPVLIAFFQDVDAGTLKLEEPLTMRKDLIAPHAGEMQYLPEGTQFSALETAEEMIRISDNTATNMLIDRLGGIPAMNQRFQQWGLTQTTINEWLPDLEGTNISSPQDLVTLLSLVEQGQLVSLRSRDRLLAILRTPVTNTLLPQGLDEGATIAHKTGDIGSLVGDLGLIDMPSGKRYLATMMVERPHNDNRAQELIRQMSRSTYDYLNELPLSTPASPRSGGVIPQQSEAISPASL